ncbi:MAG: VOC family protein [Actinomycetota bacterium]|nr:VOC family protein [Actinomycetota bacterium]
MGAILCAECAYDEFVKPVVQVTALDHIVLKCADVATTLAWYLDVLGLAAVRVDEWRAGTAPFPSVRVGADTIIDLVPGSTDDGRLEHFCLVVRTTDLDTLAQSGRLHVLEGPVPRYGARGMGTSLYVRDPDGAVVELRHY